MCMETKKLALPIVQQKHNVKCTWSSLKSILHYYCVPYHASILSLSLTLHLPNLS